MAEDSEKSMPAEQNEMPPSARERNQGRYASDDIIRALLQLAPSTTSKETKILLHQVHRLSIPVIYNKIVRLNKLSNKELLHFITIMNAHPCYGPDLVPYGGLNLDDLINLKFPAQDKYLSQVAVGYFGMVEKVYDKLSPRHRLEIFYRYLYLFENGICTDLALYPLFSFVLRKGFLDTFLFRQFYLNFIFLKEFLVDFRTMGNRIVKIGYEVPQVKELVYQLLISQDTRDAMPNWLAQRWNVPIRYSISEMFYLFDCVYFMDDLANRHFGMTGDILEAIASDLKIHGCVLDPQETDPVVSRSSEGRICMNGAQGSECQGRETGGEKVEAVGSKGCTCAKLCEDTGSKVEKMIEMKKRFISSILSFNKTMQLGSLGIKHLRISPLTDLKVLGEFICKEKNTDLLAGFTESFNFHKIDILESLRIFLGSFYLIGESQIIERIIRIFVEVYLEQNKLGAAHSFEAYKSVAYSFIVLNTMLHNPSIDKRPPFEEYCRLLSYTDDFVIDKETLRSYYNSIKDREIKFPTAWEDSYDKYLLSIQLSKERFQILNTHSSSRAGAPGESNTEARRNLSQLNGLETVDQKEIVFDEIQNSLSLANSTFSSVPLCCRCILLSYRHLFNATHKNFFFMDPLSFLKTCRLIGTQEMYCGYIFKNRSNVSKALIACKCYLENYSAPPEIVEEFVLLLGKIEKPKASVFSELKSLFSTSRNDLHGADLSDKITNSVLPPFAVCLEKLLKTKFVNGEVCNGNIRAIAQHASFNSSSKNGSYFVRSLFVHIILHNIEMVDDIAYLERGLAYRVIEAKISLLGSLSDSEKLKYFSSKGTLDEDEFNIFRKIELYNSDGFDVFCKAQLKHDDLDRIIAVEHLDDEHPEDAAGKKATNCAGFRIHEKYAEPLKDTKNILRLFTTSSSVLNLKIAKSIHKSACPLTIPLFLDFDKIAYLLIKCNNGPEDLVGYALYLMNYLSDSLVLLIRIYTHVYSILSKMEPGFRHSLMKILVKRLETFKKTGNVCCEHYRDESQQLVRSFLEKLISDSFISKDDISFLLSVVNKPEVVEL